MCQWTFSIFIFIVTVSKVVLSVSYLLIVIVSGAAQWGILGGQGGGIRLFFVTILLLKFIVLCFMVRMDKMNLF